ncbi:hypothetical protein CC80DRAFT_547667 [Byssothecium circinans]|uniref:Galactose oxidase n=1 Tax=Byssothecium circinans TaxID=147558 RepID=A0A6A5TXA3_9PLEO|nr:hypothetical protein CC80DRAFT_547667 [Byssothecium circinans]
MAFVWHLLLLVTLVIAQSPSGPDPVQHFCMRWWSQTIVKNDILYIDSGVQKFNVSGTKFLGNINYMMTVPLTESWDWKKSKGEPLFLDVGTELKNITNPKTSAAVPNLFRGHMYHGPYNTTEIYRYGGTTYMGNQSYEGKSWPENAAWPLWTYNTNSSNSKWNQYNVGQPWMPNHGAGADASDLGLGFYLNGQIDMGTSAETAKSIVNTTQEVYMPLDGMLILDLVIMNPLSANISTSKMRGNLPRVGGTLDYIASVGDNGILVALGGQTQPVLTEGTAQTTTGQLIDFSSVDIFDIDSYLKDMKSNGTWYQQNTTGDVPPARIDYCSVSISAPDNSSHHIYVYGGYNPITNVVYDDIVVLSLPSFRWTIVWPNGENPRIKHTCHIGGKRQMITVGGNLTSTKGCDWEEKGVAVFDMTSLEWGSVFNANLPVYEVPKPVWVATNGKGNGSATIGEPGAGWSSEGLHQLFWKSRWTVPKTWTSKPPANLPGPNGNNNSDKGESKNKMNKKNVAAIAGGTVAGVAALSLIATGIFIWLRRKPRDPAELHGDGTPLRPESIHSKDKDELRGYELQGMNENNPAELPGMPVGQEMGADAAVRAVEVSGTTVAPGGYAGVPMIRTPGDDLPERPEYTPGLRRPPAARRRSGDGSRGGDRSPIPRGPSYEGNEERSSTPPEETPTKPARTARSSRDALSDP